MKSMTVYDYLMHHTDAGELAVIRDGGWVKGIVYIDYEDLATTALPRSLLDSKVLHVHYETNYNIADQTIACYVIDIK